VASGSLAKSLVQRPNKNQLHHLNVKTFIASAVLLGFVANGWAGSYGYTNSSTITINDVGAPPTVADLYPSTISISGLDGQTISQVTVTLYGLTHSFPSDLDILLAGPGGQFSMLMSEVGGNTRFPVSNLTLTLDDTAANPLPINSTLTSGTFQPTRQNPTLAFLFPSPAPAGSSSAAALLSVFNGTDPNGNWNLFVVDESSPDSGSISGWSMEVTTIPEPGSFGMAALGLGCLAAMRIRRKLKGVHHEDQLSS
jgi:subtilisin-like proprotein convertase family protein